MIGLLEDYFAKYVDYDFTARMEDDLDRIAAGELGREAWLQTFYFGPPPRRRRRASRASSTWWTTWARSTRGP
ncbi:hypothetical protein GY12_14045 [Micrococcus luteus]|nr:hypothetical protein GY12_14045 [Micrococcus luteus]